MSQSRELSGRFDLAVIGGGVHGAAAALEAAQQGRDVVLVERGDYCSGVSANSLRIIHGGLRYLQYADLRRSRQSAREQHSLLEAAPHLVRPLTCLMGTGDSLMRGRTAMRLGLWLYDTLVCMGLPQHAAGRLLSAEQADSMAGTSLFQERSGVAMWRDAQVLDPERLVLTYLKTAERAGARVANYSEAIEVLAGTPNRLRIRDVFTQRMQSIQADVIVDTAGFIEPHRHWTRAVNLVLEREPPACAVGAALAGSRESGRQFFATPLAGRTLVGTWYFADRREAPERLTREELDRCLADVGELFPGLDAGPDAVSLVHVGRLPVRDAAVPLSLLDRPRIRPVMGSRRIVGLTGVKFTTARPTAARALRAAGLKRARSGGTEPWYGCGETREATERAVAECLPGGGEGAEKRAVVERLCRQYGSLAADIARLADRAPNGLERIPGSDAIRAEIDYCIDQEHCRTLADFVLRRSGLGSLGAPPPETARYCAAAMGGRLGWDQARIEAELAGLASRYQYLAADS